MNWHHLHRGYERDRRRKALEIRAANAVCPYKPHSYKDRVVSTTMLASHSLQIPGILSPNRLGMDSSLLAPSITYHPPPPFTFRTAEGKRQKSQHYKHPWMEEATSAQACSFLLSFLSIRSGQFYLQFQSFSSALKFNCKKEDE